MSDTQGISRGKFFLEVSIRIQYWDAVTSWITETISTRIDDDIRLFVTGQAGISFILNIIWLLAKLFNKISKFNITFHLNNLPHDSCNGKMFSQGATGQ